MTYMTWARTLAYQHSCVLRAYARQGRTVPRSTGAPTLDPPRDLYKMTKGSIV